jgi:hypothetical protein
VAARPTGQRPGGSGESHADRQAGVLRRHAVATWGALAVEVTIGPVAAAPGEHPGRTRSPCDMRLRGATI